MLKLAPDFALGYNNLANAYYMKGQFDEAITYCDKAVMLGFEAHPEFMKLLEPHRRKAKKPSAKKSKIKQSKTERKTPKKGKAKKSE
jgi:tetratricopeptide (TPR) repeat protein